MRRIADDGRRSIQPCEDALRDFQEPKLSSLCTVSAEVDLITGNPCFEDLSFVQVLPANHSDVNLKIGSP